MSEQQEHTETLTLAYESKGHRADAKAVGAGILMVQSMIDEVQDTLDENERILLKARPFAKGSLELSLDLIAFGAAIILHEYPLLQKIRELIAQYFEIKRSLRGQPIQVEDGNVIVIENSRIHVDQLALRLLDPGSAVSKTCSDAFLAIEKDKEISGLRICSSASEKPLAHISRDEFAYYHPDTALVLQDLGQQQKESRESLIIRQPAFDPGLAWRFVWRAVKMPAKILDTEFQKRVENGQESFVAGDSLDVTLRRLQKYDPASLTYVDYHYEIVRVWRHNRRAKEQQGNLFE